MGGYPGGPGPGGAGNPYHAQQQNPQHYPGMQHGMNPMMSGYPAQHPHAGHPGYPGQGVRASVPSSVPQKVPQQPQAAPRSMAGHPGHPAGHYAGHGTGYPQIPPVNPNPTPVSTQRPRAPSLTSVTSVYGNPRATPTQHPPPHPAATPSSRPVEQVKYI